MSTAKIHKAFLNVARSTTIFGTGLLFISCNQNPYPANATFVAQKAEVNHTVNEPYTVQGDTSVTCDEGKDCSVSLVGNVPSGKAILEFENLPAGARYDANAEVLSYTPGYDVVDPLKDGVKKTLPVIGIVVRSSADAVTVGRSTLTITVIDVKRPVAMSFVSGDTAVKEGELLEQTIKVESPDFTEGFSLVLKGAPAGTVVTEDPSTPGLFKVDFQPGYDFVKSTDPVSDGNFTKKLTVKYVAYSPVGMTASLTKDWTITDVRLPPIISAPDAITQGLNVNFGIRADDPNGESIPEIVVDTTNIPFGEITVSSSPQTSSAGDTALTSSFKNVQWDHLTASNLGTTTPIAFVACLKSVFGFPSNCAGKITSVTLAAGTAGPTPTPVPTPASTGSTPAPSASPSPTPSSISRALPKRGN